jgi:hypothetical protein
MPNYNNTISNPTSRILGSGRIRISSYQEDPVWVDVGPADGIEFDEGLVISDIEADNTQPYKEVTKAEPSIKFSMFEVLATRIKDIIRSGFDEKIVNPGTITSVTKVFAATDVKTNVIYTLPLQNATLGKPTLTTFTQRALELVEHTDFVWAQDDAGNWGILFFNILTADATLVYSVTPAASVTYMSGANTTLPYFMVWVYSRNDGNPVDIVLFKAQIKEGEKLQLKKDNDTDRRAKIDMVCIGTYDDPYHGGNTYSRTQRSGF